MRKNSMVVTPVVCALLLCGCTVDLPDSHPAPTQVSYPAPVVITLPQAPPVQQPGNPTSAPPPSNSQPAGQPTSPPANNPPPAASGCNLGRGTGDGEGCPRTNGMFIDDMDRAHARVASRRGDLFRGGRVPTENWNAYYDAMIAELQGMGYCAMFDGHDIAVKNTNAFNEQYHVIASNGAPRTGEGSYRATCRPAWF